MPTVAQKLCNDIVEPVFTHSTPDCGKVKLINKFVNSSSIIKQNANAKPLRSMHIDKKANSKIKTSHTNGTTITKSKTSILKTLTETAVNTLVSGPLRCDNNCVTLVRKRDQESYCKCGHRRTNFKGTTKSIQTLNRNNFSLTDKACTHYVETITCGTQLLDKTNSLLNENKIKSNTNTTGTLKESGRSLFKSRTNIEQSSHITGGSYKHQLDNSTNFKPLNLRYVPTKRWALTNYPTRGPDF